MIMSGDTAMCNIRTPIAEQKQVYMLKAFSSCDSYLLSPDERKKNTSYGALRLAATLLMQVILKINCGTAEDTASSALSCLHLH